MDSCHNSHQHGLCRADLAEAVEQIKAADAAKCHEVIATLGQHLAQLQERVKLDSRNSSKQSSSDAAGTGWYAPYQRCVQPKQGDVPRVALLDEGEIDAVHECRPPEVCECGLQIGLRTLALFGALETKSYLTKDKISALLRGAKVRCSLMAISQARQRPV